MTREYFISLDVEGSNLINGVKVSISTEMITDMERKMRIDLCDDPLYAKLCEYVKNNPAKELIDGY